VNGFIAGLGGRDITLETIDDMVSLGKKTEVRCQFLGLKPELLKEDFYAE
jgi:hypothetical protein